MSYLLFHFYLSSFAWKARAYRINIFWPKIVFRYTLKIIIPYIDSHCNSAFSFTIEKPDKSWRYPFFLHVPFKYICICTFAYTAEVNSFNLFPLCSYEISILSKQTFSVNFKDCLQDSRAEVRLENSCRYFSFELTIREHIARIF